MLDKNNADGIFPEYAIDDDTGIYELRRDLKSLQKESLTFWTLEQWLGHFTKQAERIFREKGIAGYETLEPAALLFQVMVKPKCSDHAVELACHIWLGAHAVADAIKSGDSVRAARESMVLTYYSLALEKAPHEKPAKSGRRCAEGGEKGRNSQGRRYNDTAINHAKWHEYADAIRAAWPNKEKMPSDRKVAQAVSKHFRANLETVRKALQKKAAK